VEHSPDPNQVAHRRSNYMATQSITTPTPTQQTQQALVTVSPGKLATISGPSRLVDLFSSGKSKTTLLAFRADLDAVYQDLSGCSHVRQLHSLLAVKVEVNRKPDFSGSTRRAIFASLLFLPVDQPAI
jgi:hypothetical protein